MGREWTKDQLAAMEKYAGSLLVSAGAGSGKTAVLVERIGRMISRENPIDIDRILIVTFTQAAASEMRDRILKDIREKMEKNPSDENLKRQSSLVSNASIMTIDSFCKKVVDENIHSSGIIPGYKIASGDELSLMERDAVREVLEEEFEKRDPNFIRIADNIMGDGTSDILENRIIKLKTFSEAFPEPEKWLVKALSSYSKIDGLLNEYARILNKELDNIINYYNIAIDLCEENSSFIEKPKELLKKELDQVLSIKDYIEEKEDSHNYDELRNLLRGLKFGIMNFGKNKENSHNYDEIKEKIKDLRERCKSIYREYASWLAEDEKIALEKLKELEKPLEYLAYVTIRFMERLRENMEAKQRVTFSHISHGALKVLRDDKGEVTEAAKRYSDFFEEIMIDEYQDSNDVQESILTAVSKNSNNIFMVGDVKQSIYRFRQANPSLFMAKYKDYGDLDEKLKEEGPPSLIKKGTRVLLSRNFRSRKNVIDIVNTIFSDLMSEEVGDIDYRGKEELIFSSLDFSKDNINYELEVDLIDVDQALEEVDDEDAMGLKGSSSLEIEAKMVAKRIRDIVEGKKMYIKEGDSKRYLSYKDIVILLRSTKQAAPVFKKALQEIGVPFYSEEKTGYFSNMEVQTVISLLKVIDNPLDDIPLLALLRSPIYSFREDELIEIRLEERNKNYYDSLTAYYKLHKKKLEINDSPESYEVKTSLKIKKFLEDMDRWRKLALYMPLDEFLWQLYEETNFYEYSLAMVGGQQRGANLRMLFLKAGEYERSTYKGIYNFIRYLDKLKKNEGDFGDARILSENSDVVRIMSIHKSKGLEFPIVFLSNITKNFNRGDEKGGFLVHEDLGVGVRHLEAEMNLVSETLKQKLIKERIRRDSASEEMRVLYVALTRAKERLIITGTIKDKEKTVAKWKESGERIRANLKSPREALHDSTMGDWIMPILLSLEGVEPTKGELSQGYRKEGSFNLNIYDKASLTLGNDRKDIKDIGSFYGGEVLEDEDLLARLKWVYPHEDEFKIPGKVSVSFLKKRAMEENFSMGEDSYDLMGENTEKTLGIQVNKAESEINKPQFLKESKDLTGADKGIAFHTVMMHLDPNISSLEGVNNLIEDLVNRELILKREGEAVEAKKVLAFLEDDLGKRFKRAYESGNLYREEMFYDSFKAEDLFPNTRSNEAITVIGIIDVFFKEGEDLVLLDYKTDYVPEGDGDFLLKRYQKQMEIYKESLEKLTSLKVKEVYIYSTYMEKVISVPI